jgi:hypothetical protein
MDATFYDASTVIQRLHLYNKKHAFPLVNNRSLYTSNFLYILVPVNKRNKKGEVRRTIHRFLSKKWPVNFAGLRENGNQICTGKRQVQNENNPRLPVLYYLHMYYIGWLIISYYLPNTVRLHRTKEEVQENLKNSRGSYSDLLYRPIFTCFAPNHFMTQSL